MSKYHQRIDLLSWEAQFPFEVFWGVVKMTLFFVVLKVDTSRLVYLLFSCPFLSRVDYDDVATGEI